MTPNAKHFPLALCLAFALSISACAVGPRLVDHAFGFDARRDSPGIEILGFRYGTVDYLATTGQVTQQYGLPSQYTGINGPMRLGETLYVKWRIKSTGQEFEETVDLKSKLPNNMHYKRVYFVVRAERLYVYLTDLTKPRPDAEPIVGPFKTQVYVTRQIHPASSLK